ncbi:MAG: hypothetical protein AAF399_09730 [Bacteroidota bacterium]
MKDIFDSDQLFIGWASFLLLLCGLLGMTVMLLCRLTNLGICESTWIPLFGGFQVFRTELATVNLPLALIILGIGLRLPTGFGWTTCVLLLSVLGGLFGFLSYWLWRQYAVFQSQVAENQILPQDYPIFESMAVNIGFAILCLAGVWYLFLPNVRRMYWQRNAQPPVPEPTNSTKNQVL